MLEEGPGGRPWRNRFLNQILESTEADRSTEVVLAETLDSAKKDLEAKDTVIRRLASIADVSPDIGQWSPMVMFVTL